MAQAFCWFTQAFLDPYLPVNELGRVVFLQDLQ
jgi:hypothetical protein